MTAPTRRRFLQATGTLTTALSIASAGCTAPRLDRREQPTEDLDTEAYTQFRHGLKRHGYQPVTVPETVQIDWTLRGVNTGDHTAAKASPVAAPTGEIVVPGDTGTVYMVDQSGTVQWTAAVEPTERGIHGTPVIANNTVYIGAYDGAFYAFDLSDGERRWRAALGDAIGSSPAYYNGRIYIAVEHIPPDGEVFGLNAASGKTVWKDSRPTDHPHSTVAIDRDHGRLVVGSNDGTCYAWSYPDLDLEWQFDTDGPIKGPVATNAGRAYFGSWDNSVYCLDLDDGTTAWEFETDGGVMAGAAIDPAGTVYIGSQRGTLYALDGESGEPAWEVQLGGSIIGSPTATQNLILVGAYDATLYAVARATGEIVWTVTGNGNTTSAPLVHDDAIYYTERASDDAPGNLYRLTEG